MCSELSVELERKITVLQVRNRLHIQFLGCLQICFPYEICCVCFQDGVSPELEEHSTVLGSGTIPLNLLPLGKEVDITVPLGKVTFFSFIIYFIDCST